MFNYCLGGLSGAQHMDELNLPRFQKLIREKIQMYVPQF